MRLPASLTNVKGVVVAHPQVQHAFQVARALEEAGLLQMFITSIALDVSYARLLPFTFSKYLEKRVAIGVPRDHIKLFPRHELFWRLVRPVLPYPTGQNILHKSFWAFDERVARYLASRTAQMVVGYENSCMSTFRVAKSLGMICVLDAASIHYQSQAEVLERNLPPSSLLRITDRKAEEIRLADHILTLSTFARDTYMSAGVPKQKISVIPLGTDYSPSPQRPPARRGIEFTYLFVGNLQKAKGVDLLTEAFERIPVPQKRLILVGAMGDLKSASLHKVPNVTLRGYLSREDLLRAYREADVFVFPSKLDGFGQVVLEAMAAGLPVIVSDRAGAKDSVVPGKTGWIFESGNLVALAECMWNAYVRRDQLCSIGRTAAESVTACGWDGYRKRVGAFYYDLVRDMEVGA